MKKITLLTVAFIALTAVSCKKDRTCTCTSTSTTTTTNSGSNTSTALNGTTSSSSSNAYVILKAKKSVARPNCLSTKSTDTDKYAEGTSFETTQTSTNESTCTLN